MDVHLAWAWSWERDLPCFDMWGIRFDCTVGGTDKCRQTEEHIWSTLSVNARSCWLVCLLHTRHNPSSACTLAACTSRVSVLTVINSAQQWPINTHSQHSMNGINVEWLMISLNGAAAGLFFRYWPQWREKRWRSFKQNLILALPSATGGHLVLIPPTPTLQQIKLVTSSKL